jgi:outer membrane protein OmpA-like peptidoglycan-associated protein
VRDFLVTRGGVAPDRLRARGYGEAVPIGDNATLAGRQTNRRVEFVIVSAGG